MKPDQIRNDFNAEGLITAMREVIMIIILNYSKGVFNG
jgi:hypothetical protein